MASNNTPKLNSTFQMILWYLKNLPLVCTILFVVIVVAFKIHADKHIADIIICVQPHQVMSGNYSRLIKYIIFHKDWRTLLISLSMLATYGTVAERQAGSLRFFYNMLLFITFSAFLTVVFSVGLGFSSQFSSIMYTCPSYGLTPGLLAASILVYRNIPMKKMFLFVAIPTYVVPWGLLGIFQLIAPTSPFLGNLCGCIVGTLYILGLNKWFGLCTRVSIHGDTILLKVFKYLPIPKYYPGSSPKLPVYHDESSYQNGSATVDTPSNKDGDISLYKVEKLQKMGFTEQQSVAALTSANDDINKAVEIITNQRDVSIPLN